MKSQTHFDVIFISIGNIGISYAAVYNQSACDRDYNSTHSHTRFMIHKVNAPEEATDNRQQWQERREEEKNRVKENNNYKSRKFLCDNISAISLRHSFILVALVACYRFLCLYSMCMLLIRNEFSSKEKRTEKKTFLPSFRRRR